MHARSSVWSTRQPRVFQSGADGKRGSWAMVKITHTHTVGCLLCTHMLLDLSSVSHTHTYALTLLYLCHTQTRAPSLLSSLSHCTAQSVDPWHTAKRDVNINQSAGDKSLQIGRSAPADCINTNKWHVLALHIHRKCPVGVVLDVWTEMFLCSKICGTSCYFPFVMALTLFFFFHFCFFFTFSHAAFLTVIFSQVFVYLPSPKFISGWAWGILNSNSLQLDCQAKFISVRANKLVFLGSSIKWSCREKCRFSQFAQI